MVGHSSWKCPNSLHLKHLLLSLLIGLPETLECLVLGLLPNLPKGLLGLNDPVTKSSTSISFVIVEGSKTSISSIASFVKVSFEFSPGLGQERLEDLLYGFAFEIHLI